MGALGVAGTGCADGEAGVTGVAGEAGGAAVGAVMGVTVTPMTAPLIPFFCTEPFVPRAVRVASRFAAAAALASTVSGARVFG